MRNKSFFFLFKKKCLFFLKKNKTFVFFVFQSQTFKLRFFMIKISSNVTAPPPSECHINDFAYPYISPTVVPNFMQPDLLLTSLLTFWWLKTKTNYIWETAHNAALWCTLSSTVGFWLWLQAAELTEGNPRHVRPRPRFGGGVWFIQICQCYKKRGSCK